MEWLYKSMYKVIINYINPNLINPDKIPKNWKEMRRLEDKILNIGEMWEEVQWAIEKVTFFHFEFFKYYAKLSDQNGRNFIKTTVEKAITKLRKKYFEEYYRTLPTIELRI